MLGLETDPEAGAEFGEAEKLCIEAGFPGRAEGPTSTAERFKRAQTGAPLISVAFSMMEGRGKDQGESSEVFMPFLPRCDACPK